MSNLNDDNGLEQFFNKAAKRYNINYDENDWQKMEKMLDAENARALSVRSRRWKAAAIGFGLLSLSLMIYFVIDKSGALSSAKIDTVENTIGGDGSKLKIQDSKKASEEKAFATGVDSVENIKRSASSPETETKSTALSSVVKKESRDFATK